MSEVVNNDDEDVSTLSQNPLIAPSVAETRSIPPLTETLPLTPQIPEISIVPLGSCLLLSMCCLGSAITTIFLKELDVVTETCSVLILLISIVMVSFIMIKKWIFIYESLASLIISNLAFCGYAAFADSRDISFSRPIGVVLIALHVIVALSMCYVFYYINKNISVKVTFLAVVPSMVLSIGLMCFTIHYWRPFDDILPNYEDTPLTSNFSNHPYRIAAGAVSVVGIQYTYLACMSHYLVSLSIPIVGLFGITAVDILSMEGPQFDFSFVVADGTTALSLLVMAILVRMKVLRDKEESQQVIVFVPDEELVSEITESIDPDSPNVLQDFCSTEESTIAIACETPEYVGCATTVAAIVASVCNYPTKCQFVESAWVDCFPWEISQIHTSDNCTHLTSCSKCGVQDIEFCKRELHDETCIMAIQKSECAMCGEMVTPEQTEEHILICSGIPVPCPLNCGLLLTRTEMPSHTAEQCPNRYDNTCPNGCGASFRNESERLNHQDQCLALAISCPRECGEVIGHDTLSYHMYDVCPRRIINCPYTCGEFILSANDLEHRDRCKYRLVNCPRGCGMKIPFIELASHVETACAAGQFCPLNCGVFVEHWSVAKHVDVDCQRRDVMTGLCPLGCGERNFTVEHILDADCILTRLECPNKCGSMIAKKSLMKHCVTTCPKRVLSSNEYPRPLNCPRKCGSLLVSNYASSNEMLKSHFIKCCQNRNITCPVCSSNFPAHKFIKHFALCAEDSTKDDLTVACPFMCNASLQPKQFPEHCKRSCSMYLQCPLGCGESIKEQHILSHLSRYCSHRYVSCFHGCGTALRYKEFFDHTNSCSQRREVCPFQNCGMKIAVGEAMLRHITKCRKKPVLCASDCGVILKADEVSSHAAVCKKGGRKSRCPWGCSQGEKDRYFDPEELTDQHLHKCINRMVGCDTCGEMIPSSELPQHYWRDCQAKIITCQYLDCSHKGSQRNMKSHYGTDCDIAPRPCPIGCGAVLPNLSEQSDHIKLSCPGLLQRCLVVNCSIFKTRLGLINHIVECPFLSQKSLHNCVLGCGSGECSVETCPNMLVECEDCGDVFDRKNFDSHQRQFCRGSSEVKSSCPCCKYLYPKNEVIEHTWTCTTKPPQQYDGRYCCPLGCGNELFTSSDLEFHINTCPQQPLKCRVCGIFSPKNQSCECQQSNDQYAEPFPVPNRIRMVACPNSCGDFISEAALGGHYEKNCPNKLIPCRYGCGIPQRICAITDHLERNCPKRPVRCTWCLNFVSADDLLSHRSVQCPVRPIPCKLGCGIQSFSDGDYENHLKHNCSRRIISCPLQCGVRIPIFSLISHVVLCYHQTSEMTSSLEDSKSKTPDMIHPCPCCGDPINLLEFPQHRSTSCQFLEVACPSGCDTTVYKKDLTTHMNGSCNFRKINCYLGCGDLVPFQQIRPHELYQCRMIQAPCPHFGCEEIVQKIRIKLHIEKECLQRPETCCEQCNCIIAPQFLEAHRLQCQAGDFKKPCERCLVRGCESGISGPYHQWCPKRMIPCPLGCGLILATVDVATHCDESCENKSTLCTDCGDPIFHSASVPHTCICPSRYLPCSLGCGTNVIWSQLAVHTAQFCLKRRNTCSYGCGELIPVHEEENHQKICPYRPSKCALCEGVFHANSNHKEFCRKRMVFCSYCRMPMSSESLSDHLKICQSKVGCCQFCGVHLKEESLLQHEKDCDQRNSCGECGATGFATRSEMEKHMLKTCPHRNIFCQHCRDAVKASELSSHHETTCKQYPTLCSICGTSFPREVVKTHSLRCSQLEINFQKIKTLKPFLGLDVVDYSRTGVSVAAVVVKIRNPSAANSAGITTGAVIVSVNDRVIRNRTSFIEILRDIQPFQNLTFTVCPTDTVGALQGTRISDPEDHRSVLVKKSNIIQLTVGCIPHMSWVEYCCCKSRVTMTCVTYIEKLFSEIGGGRSARLSLSEISLLNEKIGISPGEKSVESTAISSIGYSLVDYLDWLRACNHIELIEEMISTGRY